MFLISPQSTKSNRTLRLTLLNLLMGEAMNFQEDLFRNQYLQQMFTEYFLRFVALIQDFEIGQSGKFIFLPPSYQLKRSFPHYSNHHIQV